MQKLHNIFQQIIEPKYKKDNGIFVVDINALKPLIPYEIKDEWVVNIPAGEFGGNHKHPRQECWLGIGEGLELVWLDGGKVRKVKMNEHGKLQLILMPPHIPHAVINHGNSPGVLYEFSDGPQQDVELFDVLAITTE